MIPGFLRLGDSVFAKPGKDRSGYDSDATVVTSFTASAPQSVASSQMNLPDSSVSLSSLRPSPEGHLTYLDVPKKTNPARPTCSQTSDGGAPDLIIILPWTGANPRHVAKYTSVYKQLFPTSPILLLTITIAEFTLRSVKTKIATLRPAVEYLIPKFPVETSSSAPTRKADQASAIAVVIDYNENKTTAQPRILLHAFSDGGSMKTYCLGRAYLAATGHPCPSRLPSSTVPPASRTMTPCPSPRPGPCSTRAPCGQ